MRPRAVRALVFGRADDWGEWLASRHDKEREVWLKIARKKTGHASIDADQAVEEALVWGWVDDLRKPDEEEAFWLQRFTPRMADSPWTQKHRATAERLIAGGWMQAPGLAAVAAAQADGRWDAADQGTVKADLPEDFRAALEHASGAARATLDGWDTRNRAALCHRLAAAKQPETRAKRIADFIALLERGGRIQP